MGIFSWLKRKRICAICETPLINASGGESDFYQCLLCDQPFEPLTRFEKTKDGKLKIIYNERGKEILRLKRNNGL